MPLAGFVGGAAIGARVGPALLPDGAQSQYAPLVACRDRGADRSIPRRRARRLVGIVRARQRTAGVGLIDGIGGAILLGALALLLCWGVAAVALHAGGDNTRGLREALQRSAILGRLNDLLPPSGPLLHVLRRVDPTPEVRGPDPNVAAPDRGIVDDPDVRAAGDSTVKVLGTACGLGVEGSGWVAAPGLVVTNAHAVAGEDDTTVTPEGGSAQEATAVHYDVRNDLALLRVPGLAAAPLALAENTPKGADAAVVGYPENGPLTFTPARLGRTGTVTSEDSYGRGPVERQITPFRAQVRSGNSGGPVVDAARRVRRDRVRGDYGQRQPERPRGAEQRRRRRALR